MKSLPDSVKTLHAILDHHVRSWLEHFAGAFHLTRIYEGKWTDRVTKKETWRVFYDEREWRAISFEPYKHLEFRWDDVDALIVTNDDELKKMGQLVLENAERLGVKDERLVWSKIHISERYYPNA